MKKSRHSSLKTAAGLLTLTVLALLFSLAHPGRLYAAETETELLMDGAGGAAGNKRGIRMFLQTQADENGRTIYVLIPSGMDPDYEYPSVYFMPQDGMSAQQYLYDKVPEKIEELINQGLAAPMIYVFPDFGLGGALEEEKDQPLGFDLYRELRSTFETVEKLYPVSKDPQKRAAIGTGNGGYLAFLLTFVSEDGELYEKPENFKASASHDGNFTSDRNPYLRYYSSVYDVLKKGMNSAWAGRFYTYIDSNSDSALASADGGSNDIASLFRKDDPGHHMSLSSWDYGIFEYSTRIALHYGSYLNNLERSLNRFSLLFGELEEEEDRLIDLFGDWHFSTETAVGERDANKIDTILEKADWKSWELVRPALDWWTADFASCLNGNAYYAGYAWYVREFEIPETFDTNGLMINLGMVDEADETYINGVRVGSTGIEEEGGRYDGSNPWDVERIYRIPDQLLKAGTNNIAVRVCNGSGGGGWYTGPIEITAAKEKIEDPEAAEQLFYETSFQSKALGKEVIYRVFLPEGYYNDTDTRYPVVYMLHGYGSTGKSFEISGVPEILQEGIQEGRIPACIVIFPDDTHPQKASWWTGPYADMVNIDLVSEIDGKFRSVADRSHRFIAGESMGGGGAWLNAWNNTDLYAGVLDIYGALNYCGVYDDLLADDVDREKLASLRQYMVCGNHDMYTFDLLHLGLEKKLDSLGIPHQLEIDNGEHNADFYLKYIKEGFAYLLSGLES